MARNQDSLYVKLQDNQITQVVIPKDYTPVEIITIGLLRCVNPRLVNFSIATKESIKQVVIDNPATITLNLGGDKDSYNFDVEEQLSKGNSEESVLRMVWNELKEFFPEYVKDSFENDIILNVEQKGILYKFIEKIINQGTSIAFTQAIKEAHHFIKIWTIYK